MTARGPWAVHTRESGGGRDATARLLDDALLLEHALGVSVVELAAVDGMTVDEGKLALHHAQHGALVIETAEAAAMARALSDAATVLPELTASLRAIGSARAYPGTDHDRWFGALLAALRRSHVVGTAAERLAAFDATKLLAHAESACDGFAVARAAAGTPDARALAEGLRELAGPLAHALRELAKERAELEEAPDQVRLAAWRRWVGALRDVFAAADRVWETMLPLLTAPRAETGGFWGQLLRRLRIAR